MLRHHNMPADPALFHRMNRPAYGFSPTRTKRPLELLPEEVSEMPSKRLAQYMSDLSLNRPYIEHDDTRISHNQGADGDMMDGIQQTQKHIIYIHDIDAELREIEHDEMTRSKNHGIVISDELKRHLAHANSSLNCEPRVTDALVLWRPNPYLEPASGLDKNRSPDTNSDPQNQQPTPGCIEGLSMMEM